MPFLEPGGRASLTLDDVLEIENTEEVLAYRCEHLDVPLWPLIRIRFLRMIISDLLFHGHSSRTANALPRRFSGPRILAQHLAHNAKVPRIEAPVTVMSGGMAGYELNGKWFNRLTDHFANQFPDSSLVIEEMFDWQPPVPRYFDRVRYGAPAKATMRLAGKVLADRRDREKAAALVALLKRRAEAAIGWTTGRNSERELTTVLAQHAAALPAGVAIYSRLFRKLGTRILLREDGCYGGASLPSILAARSAGIVVAEYQHGIVTKGCDAYNVAPALVDNPAYATTLPHYLLTFGDGWNDQFRLPVTPVSIGSPHRQMSLRRTRRKGAATECRKAILVLGDGIETEHFLAISAGLVEPAGRLGLEVVFRPHPAERPELIAAPEKLPPGVQLDCNADIYEAFMSALAVVSEVTTGTFEALGVVPHVFVRDSGNVRFHYPDNPFAVFTSAEDLCSRIGLSANGSTTQSSAMWADDWELRYAEFLRSLGLDL